MSDKLCSKCIHWGELYCLYDGACTSASAWTYKEIDELKPCPFCGGKAKQLHGNRIACKQCGTRTVSRQSSIENKKLWNARPESESMTNRPAVDDLLLQEIYSLREKLKIAISAIKHTIPEFDDQLFLHQCNAVDFDQMMEEFGSDGVKAARHESRPLTVEQITAILKKIFEGKASNRPCWEVQAEAIYAAIYGDGK